MICRTLPMQQQRRDNVDDIEMSLLQHQLALFPHLEESVPPEVRHLCIVYISELAWLFSGSSA